MKIVLSIHADDADGSPAVDYIEMVSNLNVQGSESAKLHVAEFLIQYMPRLLEKVDKFMWEYYEAEYKAAQEVA